MTKNRIHCTSIPAPAPDAIAATSAPPANQIGEKAVVIQKINNLEQTGQVRINDIEWMARTSSDEVTIPEQTVVTIEAVQGVKLIVKEEKEGK